MSKSLPTRFWAEVAVAVASTALLVVTLVWNDWIEIVFGVDPDSNSGALEWFIVAVAFVVAAGFFALARTEWRKATSLVAK